MEFERYFFVIGLYSRLVFIFKKKIALVFMKNGHNFEAMNSIHKNVSISLIEQNI